ncbi:DNA polymerase I [Candidatus Saccharibacteria bacterium CG_4_10_14_0_2_um_filter_52_9]|nr:MAG: DNA polymerase I [Candidatus Saccharibacteria bacterium CG_4_10_14_0_2_um_filter_52_9]
MIEGVATKRKKLAIIDGKSVFYRGYYAMPNLATQDGTPTGGIFGFATMALEVIRRLKPDYVAVAWDKPKTNIRKRLELYPEYKAGRKPAPADFHAQVPILHELLDAFGWPLYELDDYEADDIMGALATQAKKKDIETMLITSDLDMLQLVNSHTHVYALKKGLSNIELYSPASFEAKYGIQVDQFLDMKALKGDSSDNIPGVPGIGEKGALELLKQFETLDGVYQNLALTKETTRKKLEAGKDMAYLSKQLASIWIDAPIDLDLKEVDGSKIQPEKVLHLLQKLEFRTLARQLPEIMQVAIDKHHADNGNSHLKVGPVGSDVYINSGQKLANLKLDDAETLFVHSFSAGKHGKDPLVLALSDGKNAVYSLDLAALKKDAVTAALKPIITPKTKLIGHDVKATMKVFLELGLPLPQVGHDVLIGGFLLNALQREQTLTELAVTHLGYEGPGFDNLDPIQMIGSSPEIIAIIKALYEQQAAELKKIPKLPELAKNIEWPVIPVLADMEYTGIELDTAYLRKFSDEIEDLISDYEQQIYGHADQEFNIASPAQLAEILFDKLKLPTQGIKKGKTGYSTAASELDKLRGQHPIIDPITQYREVAKLKNTYIDTLPNMVDDNSRLHTTFALTVAQTGRLSSNDPNLQNIPTRTDLGRRIRTAFVAAKGKKLVSADYSQFELRLGAVLAKDTELIEMFNRGADIHTATAALVYEREPEDVTKQMRRAAKVINFGILYGMSPHGLSIATGMTREQAVTFIERYKAVRQPLFDYMDRVKEQAKKDGYVETLFGRRRPMPDILSGNFVVRQAAERAAINMPIQGTEADLMKMAMIKVQNLLKSQHNDCNQLLQIHDSILVECPEPVATRIGELLKDTMENIYKLSVRLDVDVTIGDNWGEL